MSTIKNSPLEQILGLRPADDRPVSIKAALDALRAKRAEFAAEADELRRKMKADMLYAPVAEIRAADDRLLELERVDAQSADLIKNFTDRYYVREIEVSDSAINKWRQDLQIRQDEFAKRFLPFYREIVDQFLAFAAEYRELDSQLSRLNSSINAHNRLIEARKAKLANPDAHVDQAQLPTPLISVYFYKTCLSGPDLEPDEQIGGPSAYAGKYWIAEHPETSKVFWDQMKAREKEERSRQAALDAQVEAAGGLANGPHSYTIRRPGTPTPTFKP